MRWLGTALTVPYIPDAYGRWMAVLVRDWTSLLCQAHRDGFADGAARGEPGSVMTWFPRAWPFACGRGKGSGRDPDRTGVGSATASAARAAGGASAPAPSWSTAPGSAPSAARRTDVHKQDRRDRTIPAAVIVAVLFVAIAVAALIWLAAS